MRPAWRLAINNVSARRSRFALLIAAVALAATLVASVSASLDSARRSVEMRLESTLGRADLRIVPAGTGQTFTDQVLRIARDWPETELATGRLETSLAALAVRKPVLIEQPGGLYVLEDRAFASTAFGQGIDASLAPKFRPIPLIAGRMPERDGEVVIDALLANRLSWTGQQRRKEDDRSRPRFGLRTTTLDDARLAPLLMPDRTDDSDEAERLNQLQGVRLGDTIRPIPSLMATDSLLDAARAITRPGTLRDQFRLMTTDVSLTVVGIAEHPPLGGRPQAYLPLETAASLTNQHGRFSIVEVILRPGEDPEAVVEARQGNLPDGVLIQTTARVASGVEQNLRFGRMGMLLAASLAFLCAAFIIMTGLTTDATQRQRELAIVRCIGGTRGQLAVAQLLFGLIIGGVGALLGLPLGFGLAWALASVFPEQLPAGLVVTQTTIATTLIGPPIAGLIGAAWPAWRASRLSPLAAMRSRAEPARPLGIAIATVVGLVCIGIHLGIVTLTDDGNTAFWALVSVGLPAMIIGYFLLAVPMVLVVGRLADRILAATLRLPGQLAGRTIAATPYRYGFTAGAMMTGLALMVAIWTQGGAVLRDWLDKMEFPDAYASGLPLRDGAEQAVRDLPFVTDTAAITREIVETDGFGIRGMQRYSTSFIGFEPEPFFRMTHLKWVAGDPETAKRRLDEGGAVLVAQEFTTAQGLTVGDTFVGSRHGRTHEFEIVGVVTSPGLEVASRFFNIGEEYIEQSVHAVFGNIRDARERLGSDQIHLIQIALSPDVDDEEALTAIRNALIPYGLLDVGSGRQVKEEITTLVRGSLLIFSVVAAVAMLIASFGVANLIVASISARQPEFGVLRAIGAERQLLVRLVIAETLIIALAAGVLGTAMGLQGVYGEQRLSAMILGVSLSLRPPPLPIAVGWLLVLLITLAAIIPALLSMNRKRPRELLASLRA